MEIVEKLALPSFLYVFYLLILISIPIGVISIFNPGISVHIAGGAKLWLASFPNELWQLFAAGYLGYALTKAWEKIKKKLK